MNYFWLDASAVVKRYIVEEDGTPQMKCFFNCVPPGRMMICMSATVGEVISIFASRRNIYKNNPRDKRGITEKRFDQVKQLFANEVSQHPEVVKVYPTNIQVDTSVEFIERYSINNTDAIILQCVLDKTNELQTHGDGIILVSSDGDFLKASRSEGLRTFNPETNKLVYLKSLINP